MSRASRSSLQKAGVEHRIPIAAIPVTQNGAIAFQIENAMAAVGAGWALGLDWETIRAGLANFVSDTQTAPGRFNLFSHRGATLIADYGHNADAIRLSSRRSTACQPSGVQL